MNNPLCICGHGRDWHVHTGINLWEECDGCLENREHYYEVCKLFKQDNLRLLEDLSLKKV
jgi:hypothetical protein